MEKIKICMLGAFDAGKSSLVERYVNGSFEPDRKQQSLGVRIDKKIVETPDRPIELIIWDMTGTNKYLQIQTSYLKHASGVILVIDQSRAQSARAGYELQRVTLPLPFVLAVNKSDLEPDSTLEQDFLQSLTDQASATVHTSATTGRGIDDAFTAIVDAVLNEAVST